MASPTGFPLQLVQLEGSLTDPEVYKGRKRVCNAGYLVEARGLDEKGNMIFACPAEPLKAYIRKGGKEEEAENRMCICNGSSASSGYGKKEGEPRMFTLGKDLSPVEDLLAQNPDGYTADDVVGYVLGS